VKSINWDVTPGQRFGSLTAVRLLDKAAPPSKRKWECVCDCGAECLAEQRSLATNRKSSCGCKQRIPVNPGQRNGSLVVVGEVSRVRAGIVYRCVCDCGGQVDIVATCLRSRFACPACTRSVLWDAGQRRGMRHGHSTGRTYSIWVNMRQRCLNPRSPSYKDYGGRGIGVCERWLSFVNFLEDMGERPSGNHSIDRINPNGGYSPDNCRWATAIEQSQTKRLSRQRVEKALFALQDRYPDAVLAIWTELLGCVPSS
jgi:hypothetical protein